MVFMADSERAAGLALEHNISAGLHLNFTTQFNSHLATARLAEHQQRVASYLRRHRFAQALFNPLLTDSFEYVLKAQNDEFARLYGEQPSRVDGHHHMHLCSNVLIAGLLAPGTIVRRHFSFQPGEKSLLNRLYRKSVDYILAKRHLLADLFFSLPPLDPLSRLQTIFSLGREHNVEVEAHPANPQEHRFLTEGGVFRCVSGVPIAHGYCLQPIKHGLLVR